MSISEMPSFNVVTSKNGMPSGGFILETGDCNVFEYVRLTVFEPSSYVYSHRGFATLLMYRLGRYCIPDTNLTVKLIAMFPVALASNTMYNTTFLGAEVNCSAV